jgi:phosphoribosylformimino-5-aminoimidazole carboxamide ribotide isomerase
VIIFPAVDIKNGQAVRLRQGRADAVTVFSDHPLEMAMHWQEQGMRYLHLVDLDGAFAGHSPNTRIVQSICAHLSVPVQLGGGIRTADIAKGWLDLGITRLIIGTMALEEPSQFAALCRTAPGRIGVALDAENGRLKSRGWVADAGLTVYEALPRLLDAGASFVIYTDISRDGMRAGINLDSLIQVARRSTVPVIAAGGVADLEDIKALYPLARDNRIEGVIVGRAIYEKTLDLAEAMRWLEARGDID